MYSNSKCVCLRVYTVCYFYSLSLLVFLPDICFQIQVAEMLLYKQFNRHILNRYLDVCNIFQCIFTHNRSADLLKTGCLR